MPGLAALTAASCLITALAGRTVLQPTSMLAGFVFGCHWSLMPVLTSELFGLKHMVTP